MIEGNCIGVLDKIIERCRQIQAEVGTLRAEVVVLLAPRAVGPPCLSAAAAPPPPPVVHSHIH